MKEFMKKYKVAIVIVTFNRKDLVMRNIKHIYQLKNSNYEIILFDNGSTDGTREAVKSLYPDINYYLSDKNLGGAGGFKEGMKLAYKAGFEYIWCLDDDGMPYAESLDYLIDESKKEPLCIYGCRIIPTESPKNCSFWEIQGKYNFKKKKTYSISDQEKSSIIKGNLTHETASVALLGMFLHRSVIDIVGYPNEKLFLANDDVEYCLRAWSNQIPVKLVMKAIVEHPPMTTVSKKLLGKNLTVIKMEPWKLFYYIRNIVFVNKKYFSAGIFMKMFLSTILTLFINIQKEPKRTIQYLTKAFFAYRDGFWKFK